MSKFVIENVKDFDLDQIFDCGQCFRWQKEEDGSYTGVVSKMAVNMALDGDNLVIDNCDSENFENFWRNYLDFDTDYAKIKNKLKSKDEVIGRAIKRGEGIRLLNQDVWETVISFIISANNNIPRIKGCIESLCENFGKEIGQYRGKVRYAFPDASILANMTVEDLAPCRLGYRAKYIVASAKMFEADRQTYEGLKEAEVSSDEAFKTISTLNGVGPKVANCIMLFALKKRDAFPIDVWMKKVMNFLYGFEENDVKGMETFAKEKFGEYAGIAQQYQFYYMRNEGYCEQIRKQRGV